MLFVSRILALLPTKFERILRRANIKVYHSSQMKIHQLLFSNKDKANNVSKPGVYRIPCVNVAKCTLVKHDETWLQDKKNIWIVADKVKLRKLNSIVKHALKKDHRFLWRECPLVLQSVILFNDLWFTFCCHFARFFANTAPAIFWVRNWYK